MLREIAEGNNFIINIQNIFMKAMDQSDHVAKLYINSFMKYNFFNLQKIFL